jgi:hypothetical protein
MQEFSIYLCTRNAQEEQSPRPVGWNPGTPQELPVHFQIDAVEPQALKDSLLLLILSGIFCREGPPHFLAQESALTLARRLPRVHADFGPPLRP